MLGGMRSTRASADAMTSQVLTEEEKTRRAELNADTRRALQMGLSLDEFLTARQACTEEWTGWFHREMQRCNTADPVEVLPAALARVQQHSVAEARRAARCCHRGLWPSA